MALIFTAATSVVVAAKNATGTTPIVFGAGTDPVIVGLVDSVRLPGGRITGNPAVARPKSQAGDQAPALVWNREACLFGGFAVP